MISRDPHPLRGRTALVTGASRRGGIGYATACRLAAYGASVFLHHYAPHDDEQEWGSDDVAAVVDGVRAHLVDDAVVADGHADLTAVGAPEALLDTAVAALRAVDVLVCNHALSGSDGAIGDLDVATLDRHSAVDARSPILLAQAWAAHHDAPAPAARPCSSPPGRGTGRCLAGLAPKFPFGRSASRTTPPA